MAVLWLVASTAVIVDGFSLLSLSPSLCPSHVFHTSQLPFHPCKAQRQQRISPAGTGSTLPLQLSTEPQQEQDNAVIDDDDDDVPIIFRGEDGDDMPDELWDDIEKGKPSEWTIMKDLLGINVFTYLLAAAIAFFLGMNTMLGPGWLGGAMGLQGTGTYTETSESLPDMVDLSDSRYQL